MAAFGFRRPPRRLAARSRRPAANGRHQSPDHSGRVNVQCRTRQCRDFGEDRHSGLNMTGGSRTMMTHSGKDPWAQARPREGKRACGRPLQGRGLGHPGPGEHLACPIAATGWRSSVTTSAMPGIVFGLRQGIVRQAAGGRSAALDGVPHGPERDRRSIERDGTLHYVLRPDRKAGRVDRRWAVGGESVIDARRRARDRASDVAAARSRPSKTELAAIHP